MHTHASAFLLIAGLLTGCAHPKASPSPPLSTAHPATAAGTQPTNAAAPAASAPRLIATFGDHAVGNHWKVRVPEAERTVEIGWDGTSQKPSDWRARDGWFVFVENDRRVWAYDGDRDLLLFSYTPQRNGGTYAVSGPKNFGVPVPDAVLTRLSEAGRKAIE